MSQSKKILKAVIIDDEIHARDIIKTYLAKIENIEVVGEANNGLAGLELVEEHKPGIVFLDIQMPELNGFELLENMDLKNYFPSVIFITAFDNYAIKAFEVNAIDYLLKPFEFDRFYAAVQKAVKSNNETQLTAGNMTTLLDYFFANQKTTEQPLNRILVKEKKKAFFIKTNDIKYAEAANYYTNIFCTDGKKYLLTLSLGALEKKLDKTKFARIHKSHVINLDFVKELVPHFNGEYIIIMNDNTQLKLSRNYKDNLNSLLI